MRAFAFVAILLAVICGNPTLAQEPDWPDPSSTTASANVRFEIVQTGSGNRGYRLDKTTGQVWYLERVASLSASKLVWRPIPPPGDAENAPRPAAVNYQLFHSARTDSTLLMNVHSGATWSLRHTAGKLQWDVVAPEE